MACDHNQPTCDNILSEHKIIGNPKKRITLTPPEGLTSPIAFALYEDKSPVCGPPSIDPLDNTSLFVVSVTAPYLIQISNQNSNSKKCSGSRLCEVGSTVFTTPHNSVHGVSTRGNLVYVIDMFTSHTYVFSIAGDFVTTFYPNYNNPYLTDVAISPNEETAFFTDHQADRILVHSSSLPLHGTAGEGVLLDPDRISTTPLGGVVSLCRNGVFLFHETGNGLSLTRKLFSSAHYLYPSSSDNISTWPSLCCHPSRDLIYLITPSELLAINLDGIVLERLKLKDILPTLQYNVDIEVNSKGRLFFLNTYNKCIESF